MEKSKTTDTKTKLMDFTQKLKRSLKELKEKQGELSGGGSESKAVTAKDEDDLLGRKHAEGERSVAKDAEEQGDPIELDRTFASSDGEYESPTKKRKGVSRLEQETELETQELKKSQSITSEQSTSDDEESDVLGERIGLAQLSSIKTNKETTPLALDCRDEFIKRCSFLDLDKNEMENVKPVAEIIENQTLPKNQGVLIKLNEINNRNLKVEANSMLKLHKAEDENLKTQPEKEMGADLLLYLASSPSSSQKKSKHVKNDSANNGYSFHIPPSQSVALNRSKKSNDSTHSSKVSMNSSEINKSAPSTVLDYDGNTMLTSHLSNSAKNINNNISLQYNGTNDRMESTNDNHNKYKLLSTPVSKNRDIFGQDSSILRYATMSGGSVINSGINSHYNDIPDVVLLNSRIDLSEKISHLDNSNSKSRVIDDDISLRGLDETSDEEGENFNSKGSNGKNSLTEKDNDYDEKNKLFKTPNISNSGVISHMHNSMIDNLVLNSVSDAIHYSSKEESLNGSQSS